MFRQLLEKIARALDEAGIAYMVIGGQAVLLYGEPRLTKDIDVTLGVSVDGLGEVLDVVRTCDLAPLVEPESFVAQTLVLPCQAQETGIRVDFIFSYSEYEQQALKRVRLVQIEDTRVRFASLEDVVVHKIIAGRPRDMEDVRNMLLKNQQVDVSYIRRWLDAFSEALGESFGSRFEEIWQKIRP